MRRQSSAQSRQSGTYGSYDYRPAPRQAHPSYGAHSKELPTETAMKEAYRADNWLARRLARAKRARSSS